MSKSKSGFPYGNDTEEFGLKLFLDFLPFYQSFLAGFWSDISPGRWSEGGLDNIVTDDDDHHDQFGGIAQDMLSADRAYILFHQQNANMTWMMSEIMMAMKKDGTLDNWLEDRPDFAVPTLDKWELRQFQPAEPEPEERQGE